MNFARPVSGAAFVTGMVSLQMPRRRRKMKQSLGARTLVFPTPAWVVGTYDRQGKANVMTAAWAGICCSKPPCIAVSLRKATYTYGNIVERKAFTVNVPSEHQVKETDYLGLASGSRVDKLSACGITPVKSELVDAPYVREFSMVLECRLIHTIEIGLHTQFIGEILDVKADISVLGEDGLPDIRKVKPIVFTPETFTYHRIGSMLGKAFSIGKAIT
jgi:flavin reductase (DIM6/NTAB) family NADH-FMN oxidoreductase RutF